MSKDLEFDEVKVIGRGSFGVVSLVRRKIDDQLYVLKSIQINQLSTKQQNDSINEVALLSSITSSYIVKYYESYFTDDTLKIVMEYCNKGDLKALIDKGKSKNLNCIKEAMGWNIILQILLGLYQLHSNKILHRDLKCANVFLTKEGKYLLGDLNVSKVAKKGLVRT
jgi:NIMA (never in mitosis gene a)-related kinase